MGRPLTWTHRDLTTNPIGSYWAFKKIVSAQGWQTDRVVDHIMDFRESKIPGDLFTHQVAQWIASKTRFESFLTKNKI